MADEFFIFANMPPYWYNLFPRHEKWHRKWIVTDAESIATVTRSLKADQLLKFEKYKAFGPYVYGRWLKNHRMQAITAVTNAAIIAGKSVWIPEDVYKLVRGRESNAWIYNSFEQPGFSIIPPETSLWRPCGAIALPTEVQEYRRRLAKPELRDSERTQLLRRICDKQDIMWRIATKHDGGEE